MAQGLMLDLPEGCKWVPDNGGTGWETLMGFNGDMAHAIVIECSMGGGFKDLNIGWLKLSTVYV